MMLILTSRISPRNVSRAPFKRLYVEYRFNGTHITSAHLLVAKTPKGNDLGAILKVEEEGFETFIDCKKKKS
jgi:hypothetical protein